MAFPQDYKKPEKATIVCDWFEVSGKSGNYYLNHDIEGEFNKKESFTHIINETVSITYLIMGTKAYAKQWEVSIGGASFAKVFTEPRLTTMEKERLNLQVNNEWLYTENWFEDFKMIVDVLEIELTNISRMDVAVDGCNQILEFVTNYIKQDVKKRKVLKVGQASLSPYKFNDKTMLFETINLGSRSSDKFLVIYHKSKELDRNQTKPYIRDFWFKNGIGTLNETTEYPKYLDQDDVNRIEMRYSNKYLEQYPEFFNDMSIVQDKEKLGAIFLRSIERYFDFRLATSAHVDKCKKLELIPQDILVSTYLTKVQIPLRDQLFSIKMGLKANTLFLLNGHADNKAFEIRDGIQKVVELYSLDEWYQKRFPLWQKMVKVNQNTGHVYDIEYILNN